jgi:hypothetical protein
MEDGSGGVVEWWAPCELHSVALTVRQRKVECATGRVVAPFAAKPTDFHHSNTPILQYSNTPILQYSRTPSLPYSITPTSVLALDRR